MFSIFGALCAILGTISLISSLFICVKGSSSDNTKTHMTKERKKYKKLIESKFNEIEKYWKKRVKELKSDLVNDINSNCPEFTTFVKDNRFEHKMTYDLWYDVDLFKFVIHGTGDFGNLLFNEKEWIVLNYDKVKKVMTLNYDEMVEDVTNEMIEFEEKWFKAMSIKI